jgi:hypothetical protein
MNVLNLSVLSSSVLKTVKIAFESDLVFNPQKTKSEFVDVDLAHSAFEHLLSMSYQTNENLKNEALLSILRFVGFYGGNVLCTQLDQVFAYAFSSLQNGAQDSFESVFRFLKQVFDATSNFSGALVPIEKVRDAESGCRVIDILDENISRAFQKCDQFIMD